MPQCGCRAKPKIVTKDSLPSTAGCAWIWGRSNSNASPAEYKAGLDLAIIRGWLVLHESGIYVKFTGGCGVVRLMATDWSRELHAGRKSGQTCRPGDAQIGRKWNITARTCRRGAGRSAKILAISSEFLKVGGRRSDIYERNQRVTARCGTNGGFDAKGLF
jgi:hypothetical protein